MYKILIKQPHTRRVLFEPYMVEKAVDNTEAGTGVLPSETIDTCGQKIKSKSDMIEYSTDDLVELAEKYKELLSEYTTEQIKVIDELDVELLVSVTDDWEFRVPE